MLHAAPAARLARGVALPGGGAREHRPALAVEVAGQHVEHVDQPGGERAELLRRGPDAPVDRGALARRPARAPSGGSPPASMPVALRDRLGRERRGERLDLLDAGRQLRQPRRARSGPRRRARARARTAAARRCRAGSTWCSSAASAVRERRGSTTTTFPPRARSARSRPRTSGAVISEPLEASGFAPSTSRCIVRSRSGTGTDSGAPNISAGADLLGPLVDRAGREDAAACRAP